MSPAYEGKKTARPDTEAV